MTIPVNQYSKLIDEHIDLEGPITDSDESSLVLEGHLFMLETLNDYICMIPKLGNPQHHKAKKENWRIKCLDYLVYCFHGGYFPSKLRIFDLMFVPGDRGDSQMSDIDYILFTLLRFEPEDQPLEKTLEDLKSGIGYS